jgi:hypothetical protein
MWGYLRLINFWLTDLMNDGWRMNVLGGMTDRLSERKVAARR